MKKLYISLIAITLLSVSAAAQADWFWSGHPRYHKRIEAEKFNDYKRKFAWNRAYGNYFIPSRSYHSYNSYRNYARPAWKDRHYYSASDRKCRK